MESVVSRMQHCLYGKKGCKRKYNCWQCNKLCRGRLWGTKFDLPNKDVLIVKDDGEMNYWWTMYFDGAMNILGNEVGVVIIFLLEKITYFGEVAIWIH